jgi:HSP20 family protein
MNLVPWRGRESGLDLFEDLDEFQKEMNRLFNVTLHHPGKKGNGGALWAPAVDIIDEKDHLRVRVDLPGMKKEEIEVSVNNDTLTITGEKKEEKEIKERDYVRSERYYGAFHRSFTLPAGVDPQKVNAGYKDGVLEITLPKREDAKPKQIKVDIK